mgnify:CR=1 FL=1
MIKNANFAIVNNDTDEAILFETEWDAGNYIIAHEDDLLSWITDYLDEDQSADDYYAMIEKCKEDAKNGYNGFQTFCEEFYDMGALDVGPWITACDLSFWTDVQDGTWKITKPADAPAVYCTVEDLTYYHSVPVVMIGETVYFGDVWDLTPEEWLEKNKDALNKRYGFNGYDGTAYDTDDYSVRVTIVNGAEIVPADQKFVKIYSVDEIPE